MRTVTIANDIIEYVQAVEGMSKVKSAEGWRPGRTLLFRGQPDESFELLPSIARSGNLKHEKNLVEAAKHKLPEVFGADLPPLDLLAMLQHHGIPTRLLDLTESPLAALYFACQEGRDGEVFVFETHDDDLTDYPICQAVADSYRFAFCTFTSLLSFYEDVIDQPYFLSQCRTLMRTHEREDGRVWWVKSCCEKPMFVHASSSARRQSAQSSRYLLFPNWIDEPNDEDERTVDRLCFVQKINPLPKDESPVVGVIRIPAAKKKDLLESLRRLGVTEGALFPDSIDKVCSDLKARHMRFW